MHKIIETEAEYNKRISRALFAERVLVREILAQPKKLHLLRAANDSLADFGSDIATTLIFGQSTYPEVYKMLIYDFGRGMIVLNVDTHERIQNLEVAFSQRDQKDPSSLDITHRRQVSTADLILRGIEAGNIFP